MNQQPPWLAQQQPQHPQKIPRTTARMVFKLLLYFVGAVIAEFALLGGALVVTSSNTPVGSLACSVGILALIGSIFLFFHKKYHIHCLPWLQYVWWTLGTTLATFLTFILVFGFSNPNTNQVASVIVTSILLLYGISLMWIAHLKPSLAQQVNESVYRILKAMPGKQIVILDLLARLQREYKHLGTPLNQYIGNLEYIEQINIPGTPVMVCRLKAPKQAVAVPQMALISAGTSPSQRASVSLPVQAPAQKAIVPMPVQPTPPQSLRPKEVFTSLPDQSTAPAIPLPRPQEALPSPPVQSAMPPRPQPQDVSVSPSSQTVLPPFEPNNPKPSSFLRIEQKAIKIFCCYTHTDEQYLNKLKAHLKPQQRQGLIQIWHDRDISAGTEWEQEIEEQLNTAQIILLLVSPEFMASDYCYTKEMQRALERHARGEVRAIPIILRPTDWRITPLGKLQALPKDGKPITTWSNRDNAFLDVVRGIRFVVEAFLTPPGQVKQPTPIINNPQSAAEVELIRTRCKQGQLIVTNKKIALELSSFGHVLKSQTLLRSSLASIESKLAMAPLFGMGGGVNLTFHGRGREVLQADLVPPKEAQEIIRLLSGQ